VLCLSLWAAPFRCDWRRSPRPTSTMIPNNLRSAQHGSNTLSIRSADIRVIYVSVLRPSIAISPAKLPGRAGGRQCVVRRRGRDEGRSRERGSAARARRRLPSHPNERRTGGAPLLQCATYRVDGTEPATPPWDRSARSGTARMADRVASPLHLPW